MTTRITIYMDVFVCEDDVDGCERCDVSVLRIPGRGYLPTTS